MRATLFIVGLLVGAFCGAAGIIYLQERNKESGEMAIIFAARNFYDNSQVVAVSGTLTGPHMAYPNNTYSMACFQDRKECWISSAEAIGDKQIGSMATPFEYEIHKWSPDEVVAGDDGDFGCIKTTITIDRRSQQVLWVEEPVNQTQVMCAKAENTMKKYTIESSPGWTKIFGNKP